MTKGNSTRYFLITIDAEGDNLWDPAADGRTENARFLPRFQRLCESYGFRPTYLTDHRMASDTVFIEFGRAVVNGAGEIGMHLHAWDTPPLVPISGNDGHSHPYLIEYPLEVMERKVATMTALLQDTFGIKVVSHRAGRWSFDERYAKILVEKGYKVDCSVTPFVSWRPHLGSPEGNGGSDYSDFPTEAYFVDLKDIRRHGDSPLLEVPVTIVASQPALARAVLKNSGGFRLARALAHRAFPVRWLRPNGRNRKDMVDIIEQAAVGESDYVEFMLHSSELMPGGSPTFRREEDIEALYDDLNAVFGAARKYFQGATLQEYYDYCFTRGVVR